VPRLRPKRDEPAKCQRLQLRAQELFESALDAHEQGRAEEYQRLERKALQLRDRVSALKEPRERTPLVIAHPEVFEVRYRLDEELAEKVSTNA
jgi:hypothetical protein